MAMVLVTRGNTDLARNGPLAALFAAGHTVRTVSANPQTPPADLIGALDGCAAVIATSEKYTPHVFEGARSLRHVSRIGIGYDAVDVHGSGLNAPYDAKVVGDYTGLTPPFGHDFD